MWKKIQFQMYVWMVAQLPQRLKSTFLEIFSSVGYPKGTRNEEFFLKTLLLVFEVIVQPLKHTFEIGLFFAF